MPLFKVGAAVRDITPPVAWLQDGRIWLWGFGDRQQPCAAVRDNLGVRVVAIRDDAGTTAVLVTADLGALTADTTTRVRARVHEAHGIASEYLCINVTHTHGAPVFATIPTWQAGVAQADSEYVQLVENEMVLAVSDALSTMRPATIEFGRGTTDIAKDRHPTGAPLDNTLDVVRAAGTDGLPIATLFVAACHPICRGSENLVSSDFVGVARSQVEAVAGGIAMFVQGYAGTCAPVQWAGAGHAELVGASLAKDVLCVLEGPMDPLSGPLDAWLTTVELQLQPIADGEVAAAAARDDDVVGRWGRWMQAQGANVPSSLHTPLQAFRFGTGPSAWFLVASGHEVVMDLAARVRGIWPYERLTVAGYSNAQLSYLPSRAVLQTPPCEHFPNCPDTQYEGGGAFVWYGLRGPLVPDAEDDFVAGHVSLLDWGWQHIGYFEDVVAMASWGGRLFAVTSGGILWWRQASLEDGPWEMMGPAIGVTGLAACDGALFCATRSGRLQKRAIYGRDRPWTDIGHATSVVAMTALEGRLFAATSNNRLWRRDPVESDRLWEDIGHAECIAGLATAQGKMFAATTDGGLHWRAPYAGDLRWHRYGHAQEVAGMAALGSTLFAATRAGKLWSRPI